MGGVPRRRRDGAPALRTGVITSLSVRGTHGERVTVYLDGERAFDLSAAIAEEACLRKGETLAEELQVDLLRRDEPYRAREMALEMLGRRDLLGSELASRLSQKGISERETTAVIAWMRERGYLDDHRYALAYIRDKVKAGWGHRRVVAELTRKGMERGAASEAWREWNEQQDDTDFHDQLVCLVKRKFGGQLESDPAGTKRRMSGFLARRGHDWETIGAVLKAVDGIE